MVNLLIVFIGGGIGSLLRYLLTILLSPYISIWATFIINIIGSFLIGMIGMLSLEMPTVIPLTLKLLIITGILGGFTTFSTFQFEIAILINYNSYFISFLYLSLSIICGLGAAFLGIYVAQQVIL